MLVDTKVEVLDLKSSGIGGQAVLEGIMMKKDDKYAVAVRKPDKEIEIKVSTFKGMSRGKKIFKLPFIRGIFGFVDSMVLGIKTLTYSASFYEEEPQPKKKTGDKIADKMFREKAESVIMGLTVLASVLISIGLFIVLPFYASYFIEKQFSIIANPIISQKTLTLLIEGFIRIFLFVLYIFLISRMKDIQRTFMYHGAEHKCINCIENGNPLTIENVMKSSRKHKRCGTSFMFLVMAISIIMFMFMSLLFPIQVTWVKAVVRIVLVPLIAGISYEIIKLAGRSDSLIIRIVSAPGMLMQKLTTKEPDEDMVEVAIKSVEAVFDWKVYLKEEFDIDYIEKEAIKENEIEEGIEIIDMSDEVLLDA